MVTEDMKNKIQELIDSNQAVLFIKGEPNGAMCGFSRRMVQIFDELSQKHGFTYSTVNVWADEEVYHNLKEMNDWPTYPQIFLKSEFIGGCDIVQEMYDSNELEGLIQQL